MLIRDNDTVLEHDTDCETDPQIVKPRRHASVAVKPLGYRVSNTWIGCDRDVQFKPLKGLVD